MSESNLNTFGWLDANKGKSRAALRDHTRRWVDASQYEAVRSVLIDRIKELEIRCSVAEANARIVAV